MAFSASALAVARADPYLWAAAAALLFGLAAGQLLRAMLSGGGRRSSERLRSGRISRSIAFLSLGILGLTGLFILADKVALASALAEALLPWALAALALGIAAGWSPLALGLPLAVLALAAGVATRLALVGWLPVRAGSAQGAAQGGAPGGGATEIARLLPYETGPSSFRGELALPERDSVPVAQEVKLASASASLLVETLDLAGPLRLAFELTQPRFADAAAIGSTRLRLYRVVGLAAPPAPGAPAALIFATPRYIDWLDAVLPLAPGLQRAPSPGLSSPRRPVALATRQRLVSPAAALLALQPVSFRLEASGSAITLR